MTKRTEANVTERIIPVMGSAAVCDIVTTEQHKQANVYVPPNGGAAIFALFDTDTTDDAIVAALLPALKGEPLEQDIEITSMVEGSLLAGTIERPVLKVQRK